MYFLLKILGFWAFLALSSTFENSEEEENLNGIALNFFENLKGFREILNLLKPVYFLLKGSCVEFELILT